MGAKMFEFPHNHLVAKFRGKVEELISRLTLPRLL